MSLSEGPHTADSRSRRARSYWGFVVVAVVIVVAGVLLLLINVILEVHSCNV